MMMRECPNCGTNLKYRKVYPVDGDLSSTWQLSAPQTQLFNRREGLICEHCGANRRAQGLAQAILNSEYGYGQKNLKTWVAQANKNKLQVAELNSCHELHETLKKIKRLTYAEYGTKTQQDIQAMTYRDSQFDLVLHSETLEHVDNPGRAMEECRRVLKPGGIVLFTTPIVWNRNSRQRAHISHHKTVHDLPASYHGYKKPDYLVYYEFGSDIDQLLGATVCLNDWRNQGYVFISAKIPKTISLIKKIYLRALERLAVRLEQA